VQGNLQTGTLALHTASQLALNVGNEDLRAHLKEQLVGVAELLAEMDSSTGNGRAGVEDLERPS
jgi:hypothetical protein